MEGRITPGNKITATRTNKERKERRGEGHTNIPKAPPPLLIPACCTLTSLSGSPYTFMMYAYSEERACGYSSPHTPQQEIAYLHLLELGGKSLSRCQCRLTRRSCRIRLAYSCRDRSVSGAVVRGTRLVHVFATRRLWEALCQLLRLHL